MKLKQRDIHFHLFLILMLKNPAFHVALNPLSTIFNYSQFHEHFQKQSFADVLQNR